MGFLDMLKGLFGGVAGTGAEQQAPAAPQPPQQAAAPEAPAEEEESSSSDDSEGRNYDLEAIDDAARFDLQNDLPGYYTAEFRIEQAWEDEAGRAKLFGEYGIKSVQHYYQVKATVERYIQSPAAQAKYGGVGEIMHVKMKATQDYMMKGMQANAAASGELEPVEGVSLDAWALAQVKAISGGTIEDICSSLGIDKAKWDRVSAEWNARMSRDTTASIATAYGNAFTKAQASPAVAGASKYGAAAQNPGKGQMPITLDQYVEIMEAQSAAANQGGDASATLKKFGLSILDWSNLGAWFSAYINENAMKNNSAVLNEYNALQAKYKAKYATAKADADIAF
jgi:hypothetical protein